MRCYICDCETDRFSKRDDKPVCEECDEAAAEVIQEFFERESDGHEKSKSR